MKNQKNFALKLLDYHGGQFSALYAVGSCMLSDSEKGEKYNPANHRGHACNDEFCGAVKNAIFELRKFNSAESTSLALRSEELAK